MLHRRLSTYHSLERVTGCFAVSRLGIMYTRVVCEGTKSLQALTVDVLTVDVLTAAVGVGR